MSELGDICRELVSMANAAPPGPMRDKMFRDIASLRQKLEAMPGRVARDAAMKPKAAVQDVLSRELKLAFADIATWFN
jgi:hypothetical protein